MKIGYTAGVYDLFHIGHLNLLKNAKQKCDKLIVGITTDELVKYKGKCPVITLAERMEIVKAIKYVDEVVVQDNLDKFEAWKKYHYDVLFVGDDWKGTDKWNEYELKLKEKGATVCYLPYTQTTSSTLLTEVLKKIQSINSD